MNITEGHVSLLCSTEEGNALTQVYCGRKQSLFCVADSLWLALHQNLSGEEILLSSDHSLELISITLLSNTHNCAVWAFAGPTIEIRPCVVVHVCRSVKNQSKPNRFLLWICVHTGPGAICLGLLMNHRVVILQIARRVHGQTEMVFWSLLCHKL